MTNRPIPRRGLLGCWFLTDRGITYDSGANEAIDRSGRGNNATYQNGVTVGTAGDPSRDFGAADFDDASNQFAQVDDPLTVDGGLAIAAVVKTDVLDSSFYKIASNFGSTGEALQINDENEANFNIQDSTDSIAGVSAPVQADEYVSIIGAFDGSSVSLFINGEIKDSKSVNGITPADGNFIIGEDPRLLGFSFNGEIAAVGRYDLTVPNAPEPSEIARRWDRLTDIPATR